MESGVGRIVSDKRRSTMGGTAQRVNDAAGDPDLRRPDPFQERVACAVRELEEQRQQYRLYAAQRFGSGRVKMDPVLRSHLGL